MTPQLPSFLRRRLRLSDARKALLGGDPEAALNCLKDPCLEGSEEAHKLRERVLDLLCREAAQSETEGQAAESQRLLQRIGEHDPALSKALRRRLEGEAQESRAERTSGVRREAESGIISALEKLLGEMRDERSSSGVRRRSPASVSGDGRDTSRSQDSATYGSQRGQAIDRTFKLVVDDIGEFFCAFGSQVTIGHAGSETADLPFMADIDPLHVRLVRTESFHAGPGWRIEPIGQQRIAIDSQPIDPGGAALLDGDEVQLCGDLAFVFHRPEAASSTAILEFLHGAECAGTASVLLFAPDAGGSVRISSSRGRHFYASRLQHEVTLWIDGSELVVECAAELRAEGVETSPRTPSEGGPGGLRVPLPPSEPVAFVVGLGGPEGPPFGFSIASTGRRSSAGDPS